MGLAQRDIETVVDTSPSLIESLHAAREFADRGKLVEVHPDHLLLAMLSDDEASFLFEAYGVEADKLRGAILDQVARQPHKLDPEEVTVFSRAVEIVMEHARATARKNGLGAVDSNLVLAVLLSDEVGETAKLLAAYDLDLSGVLQYLELREGKSIQIEPLPPLPEPRQPRPAPVGQPAPESGADTTRQIADAADTVQPVPAEPAVARPIAKSEPATAVAAAPAPTATAEPSPPVPTPRPAPARPPQPEAAPAPTLPPQPESAPAPPLPPQPEAQPPVTPPTPQQAPAALRPAPATELAPAPVAPPAPGPTPHVEQVIARSIATDMRRGAAEAPRALPPAPPPRPVRRSRGSGGPSLSATGSVLEKSRLIENVPRRMRVDRACEAEVRITRAHMNEIAGEFAAASSSHIHELTVTEAMTVQLRSPGGGFHIENLSPQTQWIDRHQRHVDDADFGVWRWNVTPRKAGRARLQLVVSARTVDDDGAIHIADVPDRIIDVSVQPDYLRSGSRAGLLLLALFVGLLIGRYAGAAWQALLSLPALLR